VSAQTVQATALVHEAYLRLVDVEKAEADERLNGFLLTGGPGGASYIDADGEVSAVPQPHCPERLPLGSRDSLRRVTAAWLPELAGRPSL